LCHHFRNLSDSQWKRYDLWKEYDGQAETRRKATMGVTMSIQVSRVVVSAVLVFLAAAGAGAQGVAFVALNGPYTHAELHRLDLVSGELALVGAIGFPVTHIAFDSTGVLFGVNFTQNQLITIDVMNGSGTVVGPFGVTATEVQGLAFTDDGRLWMAAQDDNHGPSVFQVDPVTGQATWFADLVEAYFGSLAGNGETLLLASYSLAEMDLSTGVTTPIPSSDFGLWSARAVDFDDLGALWSLMLCGPCMGPSDVLTMRTIDRTTGTVEGDGPYEPHGTWGLAFLHGGLFLDGFESGDSDQWSFTTSSRVAGDGASLQGRRSTPSTD
jgi:hypothetical protein